MQLTLTPEYLASQGLSPTFPARFWSKVNKEGPIPEHMPHLGKCWVWTGGLDNNGYARIRSGGTPSKKIYAHRASWTLANGRIPSNLDVCHSCDNPSCVNPNHLFTGTARQNVQDSISKGRWKFTKWKGGELHPASKITDAKVAIIRAMKASGEYSQTEIAKNQGVSNGIVSMIVRGLHRKINQSI